MSQTEIELKALMMKIKISAWLNSKMESKEKEVEEQYHHELLMKARQQ